MNSERKTRTYGSTQSRRRRSGQTQRHQAPGGKAAPTRRSALALTLGVLFVEAHERIKPAREALEDGSFREHVTNRLGNIAKEELYSADWRRLPVHRRHRAILIAVADTYFRDPSWFPATTKSGRKGLAERG